MIKPEVFYKYLDMGLSVFPVMVEWNPDKGKYEKKPAVKEVAVYEQERLATRQEVDVWCAMYEFNGIGMATGKISGVVVLDVDDYDDEHQIEVQSPVVVKTISGGRHYWFKYQEGIRNTVRIGNQPVDLRGDGGFVVLPPTHVNNDRYTWEKYAFDQLAPIPAEYLVKAEEFKPKMTTLPEAHEGSRNDTAIRVAGHIISTTNRNSWETVGWSAMQNWNQTSCNPPLDHMELRRTFDSACQMETRNHKPDEALVFRGGEIETKYRQLVAEWGSGIATGYDAVDDYFKFLPEHLYLIAAPTHEGKTTLALNMAARIASYGDEVLFCSLEQGLFIAPRIKSLLGGAIPPTLSMMDSNAMLTQEKLIQTVEAMQRKPQLVVIDHLDFVAKDTKTGITGSVDKMINDLQITCKRVGVPFLIISHLRKLNDSKIPKLDDLRNSSQLAQVPSVVLMMKLDEDEHGNTRNTGKIFLRKNRITGKKMTFRYEIQPSGKIEITRY